MTDPVRMTSPVRLDDLIDAITKLHSNALDQLTAGTDHDDQVLRCERTGGDHRVPDETAPADLVQHLGGGGFHPGPLPGGHDDDRGRTVGGHAVFSSSSRRVRLERLSRTLGTVP